MHGRAPAYYSGDVNIDLKGGLTTVMLVTEELMTEELIISTVGSPHCCINIIVLQTLSRTRARQSPPPTVSIRTAKRVV